MRLYKGYMRSLKGPLGDIYIYIYIYIYRGFMRLDQGVYKCYIGY